MSKRPSKPLFVSIVEASTMTMSNMVNSPSNTLSQETFGDFEKNTRGIGSKIMRQMGYDDQGIVKDGQGILLPIVAQQRSKNEVLRFGGQESITILSQTTFFKARGIKKKSIPLEKKETRKGVCNMPLKYTCRGLEEGNKEIIHFLQFLGD